MAPPAEISIPTTSLVSAAAADGANTNNSSSFSTAASATTTTKKPYTLYNITLRLPLRSFVVQKRYSEFAELHAALTRLVGEAPPAPLPGKSWFRSTVVSAELTEARRSGLEAYLRAIAEAPDRRWRDTSAWRAFLNLPSTGSSASGRSGASGSRTDYASSSSRRSVESRLPAIGLPAANAAAASDPGTWIDLHKELKGALHEARRQLSRRDTVSAPTRTTSSTTTTTTTTTNAAAVEAGAAAKRALVQAGSLLTALTTGLAALQETQRLGAGELRRRRDLLAAARVERDGLETLSARLGPVGGGNDGSSNNGSNVNGGGSGDRTALFGAAGRPAMGGRVLGAPLPETERTREQDNTGVLQLQRQIFSEQDQEVAALGEIVQRQRALGLAIKDEVDEQTLLLEQLGDGVDRVQGKVKVAKERIKRLG